MPIGLDGFSIELNHFGENTQLYINRLILGSGFIIMNYLNAAAALDLSYYVAC